MTVMLTNRARPAPAQISASNLPAPHLPAPNLPAQRLPTNTPLDYVPPESASLVSQLPEHLRTQHWYCDLHHAMFLILLSKGADALAAGNHRLSEYFIDTVTVYWLVHSLMEEESMAGARADGTLSAELVERHTKAHVMITKWWHSNILAPFKDGAEFAFVQANVVKFYYMVIKHIAEIDQVTFGVESGLTEREVSRMVKRLAESGLPLSPYMPGCGALLDVLAPYMSRRLSAQALQSGEGHVLGQLKLSDYSDRLWTGGKGSFRDIFVERYFAASDRIARTGKAA